MSAVHAAAQTHPRPLTRKVSHGRAQGGDDLNSAGARTTAAEPRRALRGRAGRAASVHLRAFLAPSTDRSAHAGCRLRVREIDGYARGSRHDSAHLRALGLVLELPVADSSDLASQFVPRAAVKAS